MKKLLLAVILVIISFALSSEECPFGLTNDPYPGQCGRYVDEDGNDVCDLSETKAESTALSQDSVLFDAEADSGVLLTQNTDDAGEEKGGGDGNGNGNHKRRGDDETAESNENAVYQDAPAPSDESVSNSSYSEEKAKEQMKNLFGSKKKRSASFSDKYFLSVLLPLFIFGLLLIYFTKRKKVRLDICTLNRWVNILILLAFAVTAFTSVMLVLAEYRIARPGNLTTLIFIHNFSGIIFILSSVMHIYLKWQYYVTFFKCYIIKDAK